MSLHIDSAFDFQDAIKKFNNLYGLPINESPTVIYQSRAHLAARLKEFKKILLDEVLEVDDIIAELDIPIGQIGPSPVEVLTELADWLGDLQVYCASEMRKFGLDNDTVLSIIMASNMSKLGEDGKPIIENGKVQKGPNYWKPEPLIQRYIQAAIRQAEKASKGEEK